MCVSCVYLCFFVLYAGDANSKVVYMCAFVGCKYVCVTLVNARQQHKKRLKRIRGWYILHTRLLYLHTLAHTNTHTHSYVVYINIDSYLNINIENFISKWTLTPAPPITARSSCIHVVCSGARGCILNRILRYYERSTSAQRTVATAAALPSSADLEIGSTAWPELCAVRMDGVRRRSSSS